MFFAITRLSKGQLHATTWPNKSDFTAERVGDILFGPQLLPSEVCLFMQDKFLHQLGNPFEWGTRLKFMIEGHLLYGWQEAAGMNAGLPNLVVEWMNDLQKVEHPVSGGRATLEMLKQVRLIGMNAYAHHLTVMPA